MSNVCFPPHDFLRFILRGETACVHVVYGWKSSRMETTDTLQASGYCMNHQI